MSPGCPQDVLKATGTSPWAPRCPHGPQDVPKVAKDVPMGLRVSPWGLEMSPVVLKMSPGASIVPTGLEMSPGCPQDVLKATGDVSVGPKMSSRTSGRPQGHQGCPHGPRDVPMGLKVSPRPSRCPQGVPKMSSRTSGRPKVTKDVPMGPKVALWSSGCPHGPPYPPMDLRMPPRCPQGHQDVPVIPKMSP